MLCAEFHGVTDQFHRCFRGTHKGLLCNEFLEHVILDRSTNSVKGHSFDFGSGKVHGPECRCRRIDGH